MIVVDDDLKVCGICDSTISAVIHHEFWHTYKSNGYIENILNRDTSHLSVSPKGVVACPKEEIECDAFAWKNVGVDLNVSSLIDKYAKCGKIIGTIAKLKLMTEGRM